MRIYHETGIAYDVRKSPSNTKISHYSPSADVLTESSEHEQALSYLGQWVRRYVKHYLPGCGTKPCGTSIKCDMLDTSISTKFSLNKNRVVQK